MTERTQRLTASIGAFAVGTLFYLLVRGYAVSPHIPLDIVHLPVAQVVADSFPSFIHSIAVVLLATSFGMGRRGAFFTGLLLSTFLEVAQIFLPLGTFDDTDLVAGWAGVAIAAFLPKLKLADSKRNRMSWPLILVSVSTSAASSSYEPDPNPTFPKKSDRQRPYPPLIREEYEPTYMSYAELRNSFKVEAPRAAGEFGKILILGKRLIVSEPNVGVHIFDNSNPAQPKAEYFLNLPGNVDLAAKDNVLYADSFVDLVAIQLGDAPPKLLKRVEDVFRWNAYQVLKNEKIRFTQRPRMELGVVIGARSIKENSK